jgi:hypothetical protein
MFDTPEFSLDTSGKNTGPDGKGTWEAMQIHGLTFEAMFDDVLDGNHMTEKYYLETKQAVEDFEKNITYPYIIKIPNMDIHLDGKGGRIDIPYETE